MLVKIAPEFLEDLRDIDDANFARRVLSKVIGDGGVFLEDGDDHRFQGIAGAWIRYVSRGSTAFRVIYIRDGADVLLYRAGRHSVEDRLIPPKSAGGSVVVERARQALSESEAAIPADLGALLYTSTPTQLKHFILSLSSVSHREIYLVSPFLSFDMLRPADRFGRLLFKAREDGAAICLITRPPKNAEELSFFETLEAEDILVGFLERLHAKLYIFEIDPSERYRYGATRQSAAIIGSANLTMQGFGLGDGPCNEELCYRLPESRIEAARTYANWLFTQAKDTTTYRRTIRK